MHTNNINNNMSETDMHLFPEIYGTLAPIVEQLIADMEKHGEIYLTEELLYEMIDEAIRRAGLDFDVEPDIMPTENDSQFHAVSQMEREEAVPVLYQFGRTTNTRPWHNNHNNRHNQRNRHHNHRPPSYPRPRHHHHNRSTVSDLLSILFLQQIIGGRRPKWYCR